MEDTPNHAQKSHSHPHYLDIPIWDDNDDVEVLNENDGYDKDLRHLKLIFLAYKEGDDAVGGSGTMKYT